ncbi:MAG TPA: glycosyltransferase family 4 protein [Candidatus Paceibacterota bacterium]|nr:glycosyltransferase family 4 protein [Candidatus Paceibacterota bacterium]
MKKKILFTVHRFYPLVGGCEEVVYQLAKRFSNEGYDVTVATGFCNERRDNTLDGIKIKSFKISGNRVKGYQGESSELKRYVDFLINSNFDVTINYAAQTWSSDLFFENIKNIKSKKILVPCGYSGLKDPRYIFYFKWLPKVLKEYDYLVYLSKTYQDIIYHYKHKLHNEVIIPNGCDKKEFFCSSKEDLKEKYNIKSKYVAVCVANLFFLKGQDFIIRAFNKLKNEDVSLVIIWNHADKWYIPIVKYLSKRNNKIIFLKNLSRKETVNLMKEADFFIFGSRIECSPLVMFESFASKTLFITKDVGNTKEYEEYNHIVNSPSEMANAIKYYIYHNQDYNIKIMKAFELYKKNHTYNKLYNEYKKLVENEKKS